ncbi:MAG: hypothetical protein IJP38_05720 [Oscillospiraceae bacterium]|nr:hypothetical protein [Oscillospiraceae bacterium]
MKKVLSFILAMALVISLVPTVAFAAGETWTFDFGDVEQWNDGEQTYGVKDIDAPDGIEYNADESLNKADSQTSMFRITETREKYTKIRGRKSTWLNPNEKDAKDGQVVFSAKLGENPSAGWYQIKFTGVDWCEASSLYIYADNKYVGMHVPDRNVSAAQIGKDETFGAVYLEPNEQGKVDFLLAVAEQGKVSSGAVTYANFYLKSLSLTYLDNQEQYGYRTVTTGMPDEIDLTDDADGVEFTAYADAGDGIPRAMNGITSNKTIIENPFKVEVIEGDSVEITSSTVTDGTATIKLKPVKAGASTIKFTAMKNNTEMLYTDTKTITVTSAALDKDAEDIDDKISYIVRAEDSANNSKVKVSDTEYTVNGTNVGEWTVGESFTATATGSDFAYWANGSGAPVSTSPSYTFNPTSNFTLEAVYAPATDAAKKVQFWNYNKVFLDEVTATEETLGEKMPANPTLNGWSFTGWKTDANTTFDANTLITEAITRVVAQFTKNAAGFNVGEEIKAYDDTYTDTAADEKDGTAFSYWTIDGQVASYNKTLSFNVWDTVNVVPVYAGTKTAVPTVVLDKVSADEYFIHYEVPTGYTAVDAGIVFGTSDNVTVDSTDGSKASVKKAGAKGQFTAAPHKDAAANTVARGYVMYRDTNNNLRILYTEAK